MLAYVSSEKFMGYFIDMRLKSAKASLIANYNID
jgi:hypothetical protein